MSLVLVSGPASIPAAVTDYQAQNTLTAKLFLMSPLLYHIISDKIPVGFVYMHGGAVYECVTSATSITGTPSNYVKFTKVGDGSTATASYISYASFAAGYSWDQSYNGYYANGVDPTIASLCIPDAFSSALAGTMTTVKTWVGAIGKYLYDLLFVRSTGGSYTNGHFAGMAAADGRSIKDLGKAPSDTITTSDTSKIPTNKAVVDGYGTDTTFEAGLGGGSGTTELEQCGKAVLDKYGVDTDWQTGNAGTAGTKEIQGIGYEIYNSGIRTQNIRHKSQNAKWLDSATQGSLTVSTGSIQWFTIASTIGDVTPSFLASLKIRSLSEDYWYHEIIVSGLTARTPKIQVQYHHTVASIADYQYVPLFRTLSSSFDATAGVLIQIGLQVSSDITNGSLAIELHQMACNIPGYMFVTPISSTADGDADLPDGTTSADGNYVIGDTVYGFGMGETELWSDDIELTTGGHVVTIFTGFTNQMFNEYLFVFASLSGGEYNAIVTKPFLSENNYSYKYSHQVTSGTFLSITVYNDDESSGYDFNVTSNDNSGIHLYKIYGKIT